MTTVADLLDEYGEALRGDWGSIDGRSERDSLQNLAQEFREQGNEPLSDADVAHIRGYLDICLQGWGHWSFYCDEDCRSARH